MQPWSPSTDETSAGGLIIDGSGTKMKAALIAHRVRRGKLIWLLPKGHLEFGESNEDAAVREVSEETGIFGEVIGYLGAIDFWFKADDRRIHKTVHHFLLRAISGGLSDADIEVAQVAWFPFNEVSGRLHYPDERRLISRVPSLLVDS